MPDPRKPCEMMDVYRCSELLCGRGSHTVPIYSRLNVLPFRPAPGAITAEAKWVTSSGSAPASRLPQSIGVPLLQGLTPLLLCLSLWLRCRLKV